MTELRINKKELLDRIQISDKILLHTAEKNYNIKFHSVTENGADYVFSDTKLSESNPNLELRNAKIYGIEPLQKTVEPLQETELNTTLKVASRKKSKTTGKELPDTPQVKNRILELLEEHGKLHRDELYKILADEMDASRHQAMNAITLLRSKQRIINEDECRFITLRDDRKDHRELWQKAKEPAPILTETNAISDYKNQATTREKRKEIVKNETIRLLTGTKFLTRAEIYRIIGKKHNLTIPQMMTTITNMRDKECIIQEDAKKRLRLV